MDTHSTLSKKIRKRKY
jgi:hypothetical protein